MKWAVEIEKTTLERRNLKDLLSGLGFRVIELSPGLALTSEEMNSCNAAAAAFALAKRVRAAMTGPAGTDPEFELGRVVEFSCDPPKRHVLLEGQSAEIGVSAVPGMLTIGPPKGLTAEELNAWREQEAENKYQEQLEAQRRRFEPAFIDKRAEDMLALLSEKEPTGETLNKIYELAEGHPENRAVFQKQFGISREEFRSFQDAVHNPAVSGKWARHAYMKTPQSDQPMSRHEAEKFVHRIATRWLESVRKSTLCNRKR